MPRVSWKPRNGRLECGNPHENTHPKKWKFGLEDDFQCSFGGVFFRLLVLGGVPWVFWVNSVSHSATSNPLASTEKCLVREIIWVISQMFSPKGLKNRDGWLDDPWVPNLTSIRRISSKQKMWTRGVVVRPLFNEDERSKYCYVLKAASTSGKLILLSKTIISCSQPHSFSNFVMGRDRVQSMFSGWNGRSIGRLHVTPFLGSKEEPLGSDDFLVPNLFLRPFSGFKT